MVGSPKRFWGKMKSFFLIAFELFSFSAGVFLCFLKTACTPAISIVTCRGTDDFGCTNTPKSCHSCHACGFIGLRLQSRGLTFAVSLTNVYGFVYYPNLHECKQIFDFVQVKGIELL